MSLRINDIAPDFEAETTQGRIRFHVWIGNQWAIRNFQPHLARVDGGNLTLLTLRFTRI